MVVLGIDPGTSCGFAVAVDGRIVKSGAWDLSVHRGESPGVRYLRLRGNVFGVREEHGLDVVVYEQAHHRGGAATEYGHGYATTLQTLSAEYGFETIVVHSATLKKSAAGSGRASKSDMILAAAIVLGRTPRTDDEADAVLLVQAALSQIGEKAK